MIACWVNVQSTQPYYEQVLEKICKVTAYASNYKHDGPKSLYWLNYYDVSSDFRSDLGFIRQTDLRGGNIAYGRNWYVNALRGDDAESRLRLYGVATHLRSNESNEPFDSRFSVFGEFRGSHQTIARAGYVFTERAVNRIDQSSLALGDNAPLFGEDYLRWYFETSPIPNLIVNFDGTYGNLADSDNLVSGKFTSFEPRMRWNLFDGKFELGLAATLQEFHVDEGRLYREQFLTMTILYRQNEKLTHRLLMLDDTTLRDPSLWLADEPAKERERFLEYSVIYNPTKRCNILAGVKIGEEFDEGLDQSDVTNREIYLKFELTL